MTDRIRSQPLLARGLNRVLPFLRVHARVLLLPLVLLIAVDGLVQSLWLGEPPGRELQSLAVAFPALLLLSIAALSIGATWLRVALTLLMLCVNYAQYAFWAFYGRFLGASELHLAAANSSHELLASIALYFSGPALFAALAMTAAYAFLIFRRGPPGASKRRAALAVIALAAWCVVVDTAMPSQRLYSPVPAFATTNVRWVIEHLRADREVRPGRRDAPEPSGTPADFDVIYIIGESIRADRLKPGAYGRDVAPLLHSLTLPHVSFSNVTSHGDCTGRSVPMLMVQPAQPLNVDLYRRPTLFGYARKAGYHTAFINSNENEWREFVDGNIDVLYRNVDPAGGQDNWTFRTDTAMLPVIAGLANAPGRQFIVVETYTSHWPYGDRYEGCPDCRVYRPDLVRRSVPFAATYRAKITNSYDNAIVYFDRFVAKTLGLLRKPTLVVLTSDHGESLGEENRWGHCSAGIEQMLVPLMLIATDENVARAVGFGELAQKADVPLSHANVLPMLLKVFGYDLGKLEFPYAPDVGSVPVAGNAERRVLVSEYGSGEQSVSFSLVDPQRGVTRAETVPLR
jgi:glucan phosphoethanolaminetransferase (alkaline phosphatase superfamily)